MNSNHLWTPEDYKELKAARDYRQLSAVALRIIERMNPPVSQVCGPITTGGTGSVEKNVEIFLQTIERLRRAGKKIFNQMPFETHLFRIREATLDTHETRLLERFYLPIFESGHVCTLYFIQGWQTSRGASWEHTQAERLNMEIVHL